MCKFANSVSSATVLLSSPDFVVSSSHTLVYGVTSVTDAVASYFNGVFVVEGSLEGGSLKNFTPAKK